MLIFVFLLQSNAFYINMQLCNLTKYISIFHLMSFSDIDIGQSEAYLPFSLNHLSRFLFRWVSSIYRLAKKTKFYRTVTLKTMKKFTRKTQLWPGSDHQLMAPLSPTLTGADSGSGSGLSLSVKKTLHNCVWPVSGLARRVSVCQIIIIIISSY